MNVTINRISTAEKLISQRTITYDVYVDGKYSRTFADVVDAMDFKANLEKPTNLIDAEERYDAARMAYHVAKSQRAMRDAGEDVTFWSDKLTMLRLMLEKGMLKA